MCRDGILPSISFLCEVFNERSLAVRVHSPRVRAIIREANETVFALDLLETGGIVGF